MDKNCTWWYDGEHMFTEHRVVGVRPSNNTSVVYTRKRCFCSAEVKSKVEIQDNPVINETQSAFANLKF